MTPAECRCHLENTMAYPSFDDCAELILTPDPGRKRLRLEIPRVRDRIPPALARALADCSGGRSPWPLYVSGGCGAGKTAGAMYLADRAIGRTLYVEAGELSETLRLCKLGQLWAEGTHDRRCVWPDEWWSAWSALALAIVDELGAKAETTDHGYETIKTAIDARKKRPLVLISNLGLRELARVFDDRIASRIAAGTLVDLAGAPDQRITDRLRVES